MLEENNDLNLNNPAPPPVEESSNRTFRIAAGILAGVVLLSILCLAGYALFLGPRLNAQKAVTQTAVSAKNMQIQQAMTATALASQWTPTSLPSPIATKTSTPTPVVAIPLNSPTSMYAPLTATMVALQTQVDFHPKCFSLAKRRLRR
jgi:hypothetical protein